MTRSSAATRAYLFAREHVEDAGYVAEIDEHERHSISDCDAALFVRESAWVILSSGMREAIVRRRFPGVCAGFSHFECLDEVSAEPLPFVQRARSAFNHRPKLMGIVHAAQWVTADGFEPIKRRLLWEGPKCLERIPFIGPITAFHLAKNLGLPVAKADRHLTRIAGELGFPTPHELCDRIAHRTGDAPHVIDLVFWRFATLRPDYRETMASLSRAI